MESDATLLRQLLAKKEESALLAKADLLQLVIGRFGEEAESMIDNHLKEGVKKWAKETAMLDLKNGRQNNIEGLIHFLWEPLRTEGFEYSYQIIDGNCQMKVTKCPVAEIAKRNNIEKWGYKFSCMNDEPICEGYNPKIHMKRTRTIMEGHEYCDHFYYMEQE